MGVQISCGFHPKYRKKAIFGVIKKRLGDVFQELARRRESKIEEGHLMPDHVHMLISIPPKYSVAEVIGFMKGKSSIWIAQNVERKARNFTGHKFWARGYSSRRSGGRGDDQSLHQEPRDAGSRTGSALNDPYPIPKVAESFETAFSGSSNHQLSWWFLIVVMEHGAQMHDLILTGVADETPSPSPHARIRAITSTYLPEFYSLAQQYGRANDDCMRLLQRRKSHPFRDEHDDAVAKFRAKGTELLTELERFAQREFQ